MVTLTVFLRHDSADRFRCMDAFELEEALYKGTASLVYVAVDKVSKTKVVLKLYRKHKLSALNRFQVEREIHLHSRLRHDHVIVLYAAFEDSKYVYLVQEYAEKGDLFCIVKTDSAKREEKRVVQDMLHPFLLSLQYLHSLGIIHRDIKPENIFVTRDETIKIADFGLSIDETVERPVTRAGTLDYMAPEVLHCPNKVLPEDNKQNRSLVYNAKVDVWAAGILAYELVTGSPPFENESRSTTYHQIMHQHPEFPLEMSPECQDFIKKALEKNSKQRPTVGSLLRHSWILQHVKPPSEGTDALIPVASPAEPTEMLLPPNTPTRTASVEDKPRDVSPTAGEVATKRHSSPSASDLKTHYPGISALSLTPGSMELALRKFSCEEDTRDHREDLLSRSARRGSNRRIFSLDAVERTPSLPASRLTKILPTSNSTDDLKIKNSKQSLNLVHQLFSKKEEEDAVSSEMLQTLNRLPSYSFFPTDKQKLRHPAHRLNRELTGSQNSFTEKVVAAKAGSSKARSPPLVRFQLADEAAPAPKEEKRGRRLSFLQFRRRK